MKNLPVLIFTLGAIPLSVIDFYHHRLPNKLVLITSSSVLASLLLVGSSDQLLLAVLSAIGYFTLFLLLAMVSRGALGMGDAKFSVACGLIIGWSDPAQWLIAIWLMFSFAALISLIGVLTKTLNLRSAIAFGPYMSMATALIAVNSLGLT